MKSILLSVAMVLLSSPAIYGSGQEADAFAGLSDSKRLRAGRLQLQADVALEWHCSVANVSPKQKKRLADELSSQVLVLARQASWRAEDFDLALFVGNRAKAGRVLLEGRPWKATPSDWKKAVADSLDEQQLKDVVAALKKRELLLHEHAAKACLRYLELLAGLSDNDRQVLLKRLKEEYPKQLLARPLCIENLRELRLLDDDVVRRTFADRGPRLQRILLQGGIDDGFSKYVTIDVSTKWSEEEKEKAVNDAVGQALGYLAREHEALVHLASKRLELGEKQQRRLQLASKGVRSRVVRSWRSELREEVKRSEGQRFGGARTFEASAHLKAPPLQDDRLWTRTLRAILKDPENQLAGIKSESVRQGVVSQALIAFDRELWLKPKQREPFKKLLDHATNATGKALSRALLSEFVTGMANRLPEGEAKKLLSPTQMRVLTLMKEPPSRSDF
ncbi:MAG: hypothetical protein AB8G99_08700 [Planctomycetaceae bacterium]